jgi:GST-like protein
MTYKLYGRAGWGSAIVEAQLAWYGLPFTFEPVDDLFKSPDARARLEKVNPLAQVPTLAMPDGGIMSESAAITLLLADITGTDSLVPAAGSAERAKFQRWLVFLVANIYPTFTYADDPSRFVSVNAARDPFRAATDAYAQKLWRQIEGEAAEVVDAEGMLVTPGFVDIHTHYDGQAVWDSHQAPSACLSKVAACPLRAVSTRRPRSTRQATGSKITMP